MYKSNNITIKRKEAKDYQLTTINRQLFKTLKQNGKQKRNQQNRQLGFDDYRL